jgi:para-aminobenzoate synthetase / 4-amino-4-deoxychorismate lyase
MYMTTPFVLLDNSLNDETPSYLFESPLRLIQADRAEDVAPALADLEAVLTDGQSVAGFFSYELGYMLESRLRPLLPKKKDVPLLWFGVFSAHRCLSRTETKAWLQEHTHGDYGASPP